MSPITPTEFRALLELLTGEGVEFIVVGGVAATALGSARITQDLDVVYRRTAENLDRLVAAVKPLGPYPRGAPAGLPFIWDRRSVEFGLNFTLSTSLGLIDFLGEITGGGKYEGPAAPQHRPRGVRGVVPLSRSRYPDPRQAGRRPPQGL